MRKKSGLVSAVVDTNLFVSGLIIELGTPYELVEASRRGAFTLVVSESLYMEYRRVLLRPKFAEKYGITLEEVTDFLFLIDTSARRVTPSRRLPITVRDKKDEGILAAALGGKADYLVTGDEDLLVLRDDPRLGRLKIVTARDFLDILTREHPEQ
ncbi:MAG: putative toxin-antitoxin system toxin component, PIN family [Chloroflexi bacterium]|nr:putative toxin-antitoxin system toxin component, PIN family [Chloroflexota bacterium]MCL5075902.1 putative toxin-antitoxin system toxin component, PIN family [Chloroflexota bacterium]